VLFVSTFVVGVVSTSVSVLVATQMLSSHGLSVSLFDPLIILPVLGAALYLGLVSVFALGVGALLRSGAGGIAVVLGALILPVVFPMLPGQWAVDVAPFLLSNAGAALFLPVDLELWQGLLVVLGWIIVFLGSAGILLKRRDA
jgi:ABC-2 type transport system permease protein